jgi:hypothetical protein
LNDPKHRKTLAHGFMEEDPCRYGARRRHPDHRRRAGRGPAHPVAPPAGPTSEPVKLTPPLMPAEAGKPLPKTILT